MNIDDKITHYEQIEKNLYSAMELVAKQGKAQYTNADGETQTFMDLESIRREIGVVEKKISQLKATKKGKRKLFLINEI